MPETQPETRPGSATLDPERDLAVRVALSRASGVGPVRMRRLEAGFEHLDAAWNAGEDALRDAGIAEAAIAGITEARAKTDPDAELKRIRDAGFDAISWHDPRYPFRLKHSSAPPPLLYLMGSLDKRDERAVSIVGTRRPSDYGKQMTGEIARGLAQAGICIVSGLAYGIDRIAHEAALDAGGRTLAVIAGGLDRLYPADHRGLARKIAERGAVIAELPLGAKPVPDNFPRRNRIIAAISLATVVTEAKAKSGTRTTVSAALEEGRAVFALPGSAKSAESEGPHEMIRSGRAKLAASASDILEDLELDAPAAQPELVDAMPDDPVESAIFSALGAEPLHIDELCRASDVPAQQASAALAMLELKGMVRQIGAMTYVRR